MRVVCLRLCFAAGVVLLVFVKADAQVIIRDTVSISPFVSHPRPGLGPLSHTRTDDTLWIAPRSGHLAIVPMEAVKYTAPFPNETYLEIRLPDTTFAPALLPMLPCSDYWSTFMDSCGTLMYRLRYMNDWCSADEADTMHLGRVQAGDTVRFAFQGDFYNPTEYIYVANEDSLWFVNMATPDCDETFPIQEWCGIWVFLIDTVVTIVDHTPHEIWPRGTGGIDTATVTVRATRGGSPLSGFSVHLEARGVDSSGGHAHTVGRPAGVFGNSDGTTDGNGVYRTTFYSNWFGGQEWIVASSSQTEFRDSVLMTIRVPGLEELGKGEHYILVGAPDDVDPCPHNVTSQHYRNHYGTPDLLSAIDSIAARYDSLNPGMILRINDMSLEKGGLFDIGNNWNGDHAEHRVGMNADIGFKGINQATQCVDLNLEDMRNAIDDYTTGPTLEHGGSAPHFHVRNLED